MAIPSSPVSRVLQQAVKRATPVQAAGLKSKPSVTAMAQDAVVSKARALTLPYPLNSRHNAELHLAHLVLLPIGVVIFTVLGWFGKRVTRFKDLISQNSKNG